MALDMRSERYLLRLVPAKFGGHGNQMCEGLGGICPRLLENVLKLVNSPVKRGQPPPVLVHGSDERVADLARMCPTLYRVEGLSLVPRQECFNDAVCDLLRADGGVLVHWQNLAQGGVLNGGGRERHVEGLVRADRVRPDRELVGFGEGGDRHAHGPSAESAPHEQLPSLLLAPQDADLHRQPRFLPRIRR